MPTKIKTIRIKAFRGIPEMELNLDGKSLLVLGENGMGKSSIVDAIEFFFNCEIKPLKGIKGLSLQKHGPHVGFNQNDVNIEMVFNPGDISLNRTFSDAPNPPKALTEYFEIAQKGTLILRRSQLLEFIMSQPAERFQSIANIIGLQSLDNIELSMQRVQDELKGKRDSEDKNYHELLAQLSRLVEKNITDEESLLLALNQTLVERGQNPIGSLNDASKHSENMMKNVKYKDTDKIHLFNQIMQETKIPLIKDDIINKISNLDQNISTLLSEQIKQKLSLHNLLETGRKTIIDEQLKTCPLCEQVIDRDLLLIRLDNRLRLIVNLSKDASDIRIKSSEIVSDIEKIVSRLDNNLQKMRSIPEINGYCTGISQSIESINDLKNNIQLAANFKKEIQTEELIKQITIANQLWNSIFESVYKISGTIELNDEEKKTLDSITLIGQVKLKHDELLRVKNKLKCYNDRYIIAEKIYLTFSGIKKAKVQEIYDLIQSEINQFYSMLHPDDIHTNIKLTVAKRASTNLTMKLFNRDAEDPRALISEGHLDSLGLCIFLAFVKKFNSDCSLLILDDVVTTIDSQHRQKICELLHKEFKNYQLIITTHDEIWYEQFRASQRAYKLESSFNNLTLENWILGKGPIISQHKPKWEKIQEKITNNDKKAAGNAGRDYLEWLLKEVAENIEAQVKYKRSGNYTVIELFDPVKLRMNKLLNDSEFKKRFSNSTSKLECTAFMANLLSHDNPSSMNLCIKEVNDFCQAVHQLHEVFECPDCNNFIKYNSEFGILRCSNKKCEKPFEERTR